MKFRNRRSRVDRLVLALLLAAAIYGVMKGAGTPPGQIYEGRATVHDGDTISVAGERLRLYGVDAPELDQGCTMPDGAAWACGRWSRDKLREMVQGQALSCQALTRDRYGRPVVRCQLGQADLAERLVRDGVVFAYASFSRDYVAAEKAAAAAGRGLWAAEVMRPDAFRAAKRAARQNEN